MGGDKSRKRKEVSPVSTLFFSVRQEVRGLKDSNEGHEYPLREMGERDLTKTSISAVASIAS